MSFDSEPRVYRVQRAARTPLVSFIVEALEQCGCRLIHVPDAGEAPFRFTFETAVGERMGIIVYAFLANTKITKNRPDDEHRFQLKYGANDGKLHDIWQDPFGLYTTLLLGINPNERLVISADAVLHNPTKMFISVEFKQEHVDAIQRAGWSVWERDRRAGDDSPIEVLVGTTPRNFLKLIRFERDAWKLDQGHRQLLAEKYAAADTLTLPSPTTAPSFIASEDVHELAREFEMSPVEVLDLIARTRRLKMAVRGWVAEEHLARELAHVPGVSDCMRLDQDGGPDLQLLFEGKGPITVECKNVLRKVNADGVPRIDFQRTRASIADPCSRYYKREDFDVVAACLHSVSELWQFRYARTATFTAHERCVGRLSQKVRVDAAWQQDVAAVLRDVSHLRT